jgi:hypothetical protein
MARTYLRPFSRVKRAHTKYRNLAVVSAILFAVVLVILVLELTGVKH